MANIKLNYEYSPDVRQISAETPCVSIAVITHCVVMFS